MLMSGITPWFVRLVYGLPLLQAGVVGDGLVERDQVRGLERTQGDQVLLRRIKSALGVEQGEIARRTCLVGRLGQMIGRSGPCTSTDAASL